MNTTRLDPKGVVQACPQCGQLNRVLFARLGYSVRCGRCKLELEPVSEPLEIAEEQLFAALIESAALPIMIDFWADWCGPCKMMAPELHKFATANAGKITVAKVNTEMLPALSQRFGITAIPTLALFVNGNEVGRVQGAHSSSQLSAFVRDKLQHIRQAA